MCDKCSMFEGLWQRNAAGKFVRCDCPANDALRKADHARNSNLSAPPQISEAEAMGVVEMLSGHLAYFPPAAARVARSAIALEIQRIVHDMAHATWLVSRMAKLYTQWPGTRELRLVYASKHRPLDGVEISGVSDFFPEGIPSELQAAGALPAPEAKYLPPAPGEPVSAASSLNEVIYALASAKDMRNIGRKLPVPDLPILPPGERISEADIEAAVQKNRDEAGRHEAGLC